VNVAVIHGPNLRLLGRREPEVYGTDTLDDVNRMLSGLATELGVQIETFQSNHEGELLDFIADASQRWRRS
jgi:3-dehydroquinate dehydratase-2